MSRQDANAALALSSFLYGGNASYIEDLYARYEQDPDAVETQWQAFFQSLKDDPDNVVRSARGPWWKHRDWPPLPAGELVSALDGSWAEVARRVDGKIKSEAQARGVEIFSPEVLRATRASVR